MRPAVAAPSEILAGAGVPKGSFHHWFASKEAFGSDLLDHYFSQHLADMDDLLADGRVPARQRLEDYWRFWRDSQESYDGKGKCLAVKLGAEVSDISEDMRISLRNGTSSIVERIATDHMLSTE